MTLVDNVDEVGFSSRLLFALPMLRMLVQCVAESEGAHAELVLRLPSGARVMVARQWDETSLTVSTNAAAPHELHATARDSLNDHGFEYVPDAGVHAKLIAFDSDVAFAEAARLIIGTFQHVWGADLRDHVSVDLHLSVPS